MKHLLIIAALSSLMSAPASAACARGDRPVLSRVKSIVTAPFRRLGRVRGRGC